MAHKVIVPQKKNYVPQFLKQRDINSYYDCVQSSGPAIFLQLFDAFELSSKFFVFEFFCEKKIWGHTVPIMTMHTYFKARYGRNGSSNPKSKLTLVILFKLCKCASTSGSGLFCSQNRSKSLYPTLYARMNADRNYRLLYAFCLLTIYRYYCESRLNSSNQGFKLRPSL